MRIKDAHDLVSSVLHNSANNGEPHDACYFKQDKARRDYRRAEQDLLIRFEDWLTENFPDGIPVEHDPGFVAVNDKVQVARHGRHHVFGKRMVLKTKVKNKEGEFSSRTAQSGFLFLYNPTERAWLANGGEWNLGVGNAHIDTLVLLEELIA